MKKALVFILIISLIFSLSSCFGASPFDALFLTMENSLRFENSHIKYSTDTPHSATCAITPQGFKMDLLEEKDYKMKITVTYDVYYEKDWDIGLGYLGAPKYEISIYNSDRNFITEEQIATKTAKSQTASFIARIVDINNTHIYFKVSTYDIQNIIYFENIKVDYKCFI